MTTEQKIAELLNVAFGNFTPTCGGEFADWSPRSPCHDCEKFQQCKHNTHLAEINTELQKLITDENENPKNATSEELREAAIWFYYKDFTESFDQEQVAYLIRLGWKLAQPGGLAHIHPQWLERGRKESQSNKQMQKQEALVASFMDKMGQIASEILEERQNDH